MRKHSRLGYQCVPSILFPAAGGYTIHEVRAEISHRKVVISKVLYSCGKVAVRMTRVNIKCLAQPPARGFIGRQAPPAGFADQARMGQVMMMRRKLTCFKAYDVRGRVGESLDEDAARRIGRAFGRHLGAGRVAVGGDARLSTPTLKEALIWGLREAGADVLDLGLCGTEEIYFAVFSQKLRGGIAVTGSHNPADENGLKFVRQGARPVSGDTGLLEIKALAEHGVPPSAALGGLTRACFRDEYVDHVLGYIDVNRLSPLSIVANPGNGAAGPLLDFLDARLKDLGAPIQFIKICQEPDGRFPNGIPNPLLPENRGLTADAVRRNKADFGLAWDGDFDRCFFFDENGDFIEGYYLVGLLAEAFLAEQNGATIIHDPRLCWNTLDIVKKNGGRAVESKTGHAFIKERMRVEKAVYGGEMSAHHYFADFAYCDSGMIPWLLVAELMSRKGAKLSELVGERMRMFPCSGEINYRVSDPSAAMEGAAARFGASAMISRVDGISVEAPSWRFNLRASNTEALLRLNVESRADRAAVGRLVGEIEEFLVPFLIDRAGLAPPLKQIH